MKHAFVANPGEHAWRELLKAVNEVGDEDWTVHRNVVVEYPDDRSIEEVKDVLRDQLDKIEPDNENSFRWVMIQSLLMDIEEHDVTYPLGDNNESD